MKRDEDYITDFIYEHCDEDTIRLFDELVPYDLIHALLKDILRLEKLILQTREKVNELAPDKTNLPYPMTAQNVGSGICFDHPAMDRYAELFEGRSVTF